MRALRPRDRRRINQVCWTVTWLAAAAGLFLGLSGGTADVGFLSDDLFLEPARPYWTSEQLGVVPFALPGLYTAAASDLHLPCGAGQPAELARRLAWFASAPRVTACGLRTGELTDGEHVTLHVFLKAVRLNGTILLRAMAWAESTDAVYYHDKHRECVVVLSAQYAT